MGAPRSPVVVAHLSDLHLREGEEDLAAFRDQLERVVRRGPDHLVITGDLLDRWQPRVLERALDALADAGLLHHDRLTVIHGNHDLASSGGHPRARADLWRLATRFWDPPSLIRARRTRFYRAFERRARGMALLPATLKHLPQGLRLAAVDSVPAPWTPLHLGRRRITLRHAEGCVPAEQSDWLAALPRDDRALIVLVHHFPLPAGSFTWPLRRSLPARLPRRLAAWLGGWEVDVQMEIEPRSRARFLAAAEGAGASAVLCGHVHRARVERYGAITIGLNGQSGAEWAGRTIAWCTVSPTGVDVEYESG